MASYSVESINSHFSGTTVLFGMPNNRIVKAVSVHTDLIRHQSTLPDESRELSGETGWGFAGLVT